MTKPKAIPENSPPAGGALSWHRCGQGVPAAWDRTDNCTDKLHLLVPSLLPICSTLSWNISDCSSLSVLRRYEKKARLRHHQCRGKGGERIALISRSHILIQLMETGRRAPDLGFVLPWKLKLGKTGAGGDLHATSPLSHSAQEPICSPCWSLMFWGMVTKYPKAKWWMWGAGIGGTSGQKLLVLKSCDYMHFWIWYLSLGRVSLTTHLLMCSPLQRLNTLEAEKICAEASFAVPAECPLSERVYKSPLRY